MKFSNFYADMGKKPTPLHTLDRIDNEGNYKPGNCRWATRKQQNLNSRNNRIVRYKGKRMTLTTAVERFSTVNYQTVWKRIQYGWSVKKALLGKVQCH